MSRYVGSRGAPESSPFQNGDSLTLGYTGGWDANGAKGAYKVVSGTGAFLGATGTGEVKSVDAKRDQAYL